MKVLFDARVHLNYYSGISRYIICLLDAYLNLFPEDEVHILLNPTIEKSNSIHKILDQYKNVEFHTIKLPHMGPRNYTSMRKIISNFEADVYHYPHLDAPYKTGGTPLVATVHDANYSRKVKKFNDPTGLKTIYFRKALGLTLKHAEKVLFVSESVKDELANRYGYKNEQRFETMYNGLEAEFNELEEKTILKVKSNLKLPNRYFLYVGQIREHKNIRRIIEAFKEFRKENQFTELVLAGHNYLDEDLNDNGIHQLDEVSNQQLKVLYHQCQAVVFPSLFEGFGFPIIEGFSFGKSVITSNRGATKEVGENEAILVDPESIEDIKKGMNKANSESFFDSNKVKYAKKFDWKSNAKRLREIYTSLSK